MDLRSHIYGKDLDMLSAVIAQDTEEMILVRYESEVLGELLKIVADPETGKTNMGQVRFSELCKKAAEEMGFAPKFSQKTISNYINGVYRPDDEALSVMGKVLGVSFVSDWSKSINNEQVLKMLKALYNREP
jgi:hypothetical protein